MTTRSQRSWHGAAALAAALVLSACTAHHGGFDSRLQVPHPAFIGSLKSSLGVVPCDAQNKDCKVQVQVTAVAPQIDPTTSLLACGVSLDDVVVIRRGGAKSVTWSLNTPTGGNGTFRFRQSPSGLYLYDADARDKLRLAISGATAVLDVNPRLLKGGFTYGVYLEWQKDASSPWQACNPLDPIIVSMD